MIDASRALDAGIGRRLAALAMDIAVATVTFLALNLVLFKAGVLPALVDDDTPLLAGLWLRPGMIPASLVVGSIAVLGCWRWLGGTPGALLMGVVLVRAGDGRRAGLARLLARFVTAVGLAGLGLLWSAGGRRALHDRLSGTRLVIEDEGIEALPSLDGAGR